MSERQDTLQQYVRDMLAVERHILPALEAQSKDNRYAKYPRAQRLVNQIESTIHSHINGLEQYLKGLGGDAASPLKSAVTSVLGLAATVSYTMLHTTGLELSEGLHPLTCRDQRGAAGDLGERAER